MCKQHCNDVALMMVEVKAYFNFPQKPFNVKKSQKEGGLIQDKQTDVQ